MRDNASILYVGTEEISLPDLAIALKGMGYSVNCMECHMDTAGYVPAEEKRISEELAKGIYGYVISHNFCETIARACHQRGIPYISWVFDTPQKELYTEAAFYPTNFVFVFDKCQLQRLKEIGLSHVYATSLGILPQMWEGSREQLPQTEIAFVGQLYGNPYLEKVLEQAPEYVKRDMAMTEENLYLRWEEGVPVTGYLSEESVAYLRKVKGEDVTQLYPYMAEQYYYEAALISRVLANRERLTALNMLARSHEVALYTYDRQLEGLSSAVKVIPGVGFGGQAGNIYRNSKINLNISLHCIESGANQRIFDIMAAGGFVLSNYQQELEELFVPGEEIVLFHNGEELLELVEYYLAHDEEREEIARRGQKKVRECYSYSVLLERVLECVDAEVEAFVAEQDVEDEGGSFVDEEMSFQELQQVVSVCLDEVIKQKEENARLKHQLDEMRELNLFYGNEIKKLWQHAEAIVSVLEKSIDNLPYELADEEHPTKGVFYPKFYPIEETLREIIENRKSLSRFGDGEFAIIANEERQKFQRCNPKLAERLQEVLNSQEPNVLVAIADHYGNLDRFNHQAKRDIRIYMTREVRLQHEALLDRNRTYHDTYISRPYALYADNHTDAPAKRFADWRQVWQDRDVIIIEGKESRLGVGNDLFDNVRSIRRIEGPATNSFDKYEEIKAAALQYGKADTLFLLAMGASATVLAYDLAKAGYQALDIGHIDMEYEWFLKGTGGRCSVPHKYNNEWPGGENVQQLEGGCYEGEIIADLS